MKFTFTEDEGFSIDEVTVYTQEPNQELTSINFISGSQDGEASVTLRSGLLCNTKQYTNGDIKTNPNAIKFLELALQDLEKAEILGECRMFVSEGSTIIPCTNSRPKSDDMGTMTM